MVAVLEFVKFTAITAGVSPFMFPIVPAGIEKCSNAYHFTAAVEYSKTGYSHSGSSSRAYANFDCVRRDHTLTKLTQNNRNITSKLVREKQVSSVDHHHTKQSLL